jgi:hypothetical protein
LGRFEAGDHLYSQSLPNKITSNMQRAASIKSVLEEMPLTEKSKDLIKKRDNQQKKSY